MVLKGIYPWDPDGSRLALAMADPELLDQVFAKRSSGFQPRQAMGDIASEMHKTGCMPQLTRKMFEQTLVPPEVIIAVLTSPEGRDKLAGASCWPTPDRKSRRLASLFGQWWRERYKDKQWNLNRICDERQIEGEKSAGSYLNLEKFKVWLNECPLHTDKEIKRLALISAAFAILQPDLAVAIAATLVSRDDRFASLIVDSIDENLLAVVRRLPGEMKSNAAEAPVSKITEETQSKGLFSTSSDQIRKHDDDVPRSSDFGSALSELREVACDVARQLKSAAEGLTIGRPLPTDMMLVLDRLREKWCRVAEMVRLGGKELADLEIDAKHDSSLDELENWVRQIAEVQKRAKESQDQVIAVLLNQIDELQVAPEVAEAFAPVLHDVQTLRERMSSGLLERERLLAAVYAGEHPLTQILRGIDSIENGKHDLEPMDAIVRVYGYSTWRAIYSRAVRKGDQKDHSLPDSTSTPSISTDASVATSGDVVHPTTLISEDVSIQPSPINEAQSVKPLEPAHKAEHHQHENVRLDVLDGTLNDYETIEEPEPIKLEAITADQVYKKVDELSLPAAASTKASPPSTKSIIVEPLTYARFRESFWIAPGTGKCEPSPWTQLDFNERLRNSASSPFKYKCLKHLFVYAKVAESFGDSIWLSSEQVLACAAVWSGDEASVPSVARPALDTLPPSGVQARLQLGMLALGREVCYATAADIEKAFASADFMENGLSLILKEVLLLGTRGSEDALAEMRFARKSKTKPTELLKELDTHRVEFYRIMGKERGGLAKRIGLTHCREAWATFINRIEHEASQFYPTANGGKKEWNPRQMQLILDRWQLTHAQIADEKSAKYATRNIMDRLAADIYRRASRINELYQAHRLANSSRKPIDAALLQKLDAVLQTTADRPEEELIRQMLIRRLEITVPESAGPLDISIADISAYPDLIPLIAGLSLRPDAGLADTVGRIDQITDFRMAAAVLMLPPRTETRTHDEDTPLTRLVRSLRTQRPELFARVGALLGESASRAHAEDAESLAEIHNLIGQLRETAYRLDDLASPDGQFVLKLSLEAVELRDNPHSPVWNATLIKHWLRMLIESTEAIHLRQIRDLQARVSTRSDDERRQLMALMDAGLNAEVLRQLDPTYVPSRTLVRQTLYRSEAEKLYANPAVHLRQLGPDTLGQLWRDRAAPNKTTDRTLLRRFVELVLGNARNNWDTSKPFELSITQLREWLSPQNPCYLPQLANYRLLRILPAATSSSNSEFSREIAGSLYDYGQDLCVVLAPRLSREQRTATNREFRRRNLNAAVFDDVDICRLMPAGPPIDVLLGMLEIVFEQMPLERVMPFVVTEGQQVKIEMYEGRQEHARALAQTAKYSRLFSGRKLGKTALLKYLEQTYDAGKEKLPSGNLLRVLYVSAVGCDIEANLVSRIEQQMREKLHFNTGRNDSMQSAGDRLTSILQRFVEQRQSESMLVVLDEADEFVRSQIAQHGEKGLSWRMSRDIEARWKDAQGLPRVRFLVSGYRYTDTREGVWANWADIMLLGPLEPDEAERLIAGPLARLGIDSTQQAPAIAFRCGYQPAVILRFGQQLLEQIRQRVGHIPREDTRVTPADVVTTYHMSSVTQEIAGIVHLNFQGDPVAGVIFDALLHIFHSFYPSACLVDAAELTVQLLTNTCGDLNWLGAHGGAVAEIKRYLNDFVERKLIVTEHDEDGRAGHRLRFPHHLPLLYRHEHLQYLKSAINNLPRELSDRRGAPTVNSLLPATEMQSIEQLTSTVDENLPVRAVIVGTLWTEAESHSIASVASRIGILENDVFSAADADDAVLKRRRLAIFAATPHDVTRLLEKRAKSLPPILFVGGVDLYRWAMNPPDGLMIDYHAVPRFSLGCLLWWFNRVRGLEFSDSDAIHKLMKLTSGIPMLVSLMDRQLQSLGGHEAGLTISGGMFQMAIKGFEVSLSEELRKLVDGPTKLRLTPRELDVLHIIKSSSLQTTNANDLWDFMTEMWPLIREKDRGPEQGLEYRDLPQIKLLQDLGLIPVAMTAGLARDRLIPISPEDAIYQFNTKALYA